MFLFIFLYRIYLLFSVCFVHNHGDKNETTKNPKSEKRDKFYKNVEIKKY